MPDLGEKVIEYLVRTGQEERLWEFMRKTQDAYLVMCERGYCSTDIHTDQPLVDPNTGEVKLSDWSPYTTIVGEQILSRFPTEGAYIAFIQSNLERTLLVDFELFPQFEPYMPVSWPSISTESAAGWPRLGATVAAGFSEAGATGGYFASEEGASFEGALRGLGSTDPMTVVASRDYLRSVGAVQIEGVWVIGGKNSFLTSGPIRLSTLSTFYPDGERVFIGMQTRWGVIGLERAENVSGGVAGWRIYARRFTISAKPLSEMGVSVFGEVIQKSLLAAWVGYEIWDTQKFAQQDRAMVSFPDQTQVISPAGDAVRLWETPTKWPYLTTRWVIPFEWMESGCNGTGISQPCGGYLAEDMRYPIVLVGGMAGTTLPQTSWPDYGLGGNRILDTWSYQNMGGSIQVWHNDQIVEVGNYEYYEMVINEVGIWMIPYHASLQTGDCPGLCIQQAPGGEEFLFTSGVIKSVELCPVEESGACWQK